MAGLLLIPRRRRNATQRGLLARLALYWDWFQYNWNEWVVSYDFGHQAALAQNVQRNSQQLVARMKTYYQQKRRDWRWPICWRSTGRRKNRGIRCRWLLGLLLVMLIALRGRAIGGYVRARWSLRAHRKGSLPPELAALQYREMLKLLERRGWRKSPAQTALEFAAAIPDAQFNPPCGAVDGTLSVGAISVRIRRRRARWLRCLRDERNAARGDDR